MNKLEINNKILEPTVQAINGHKTTHFKLFYNTPLIDYNNTIHFTSNTARDNFFWVENHYESLDFSAKNFNYVRTMQTIRLTYDYGDLNGVNYLSFKTDFDDVTYYAFVLDIEYINDGVSKISFVIDTIMTYTQAHRLDQLQGVKIDRQHLTPSLYNEYLTMIRNNDDVLKTKTKQYITTKFFNFGENYVLFESTVDLSSSFGDIDDPIIKSATGTLYDGISGATRIYIIDYDAFSEFLNEMKAYPWISQNFSKIKMIPKIFIDENDLVQVNMPDIVYDSIYTLKHGQKSLSPDFSSLNLTFDELLDLVTHGAPNDEFKNLVRNEYITIELYDNQGNSLFLDAGKLRETTGLSWKSYSIIGFDNNVKLFPENYQADDSTSSSTFNGAFLTQSLTINNFVELPIMINTGDLSKANKANQRNLQESYLMTNQAKGIFDKNSSTSDRLYDALSVGSNLSPTKLMGKANDEYKFYQQQQADYKDMALMPPTITSSDMGNAFLIANNFNGVMLKIAIPNKYEMSNIKKYYASFGYQVEFESDSPSDIESMTIMNYLKCSGNYVIPDIPINLYNQLNATLDMGVKFWHNNGTPNPFTQNILDNKFK